MPTAECDNAAQGQRPSKGEGTERVGPSNLLPDSSEERAGSSPLFAPGSHVGRYRVNRLIGRGGMGEVYLARDELLGRRVALKVIQPDRLDFALDAKRFEREAKTTARFAHPHIVTVFDAGQHQGVPYLALEYLQGETLRQRLARERPSEVESLRMVMIVLEALEEAHRLKVLHRDLKPENIFIQHNGRLRILDFGLATIVGEQRVAGSEAGARPILAHPDSQEHRRSFQGTPAYAAPEQWSDEAVTEAVDLWAVGVLLLELLTGKRPYTPAAVMGLAFDGDSLPNLDLPPDLSPALCKLIQWCLEPSASRRPTAGVLRQELQGLLPGNQATAQSQRCPFRGLLPFDEQTSPLFFGREGEIDALLELSRTLPVLPVIGPSGGGKSSLVGAGMLSRLRERSSWILLKMRPGPRPFQCLAACLLTRKEMVNLSALPTLVAPQWELSPESARRPQSHRSVGRRHQQCAALAEKLWRTPGLLGLLLRDLAQQTSCQVLLYVDQLEELYTVTEAAEDPRRFMEVLCCAADDALDPVRVVFCLRDDFLGRVAQDELIREALKGVTLVRCPGDHALREVLEKPVAAVGYEYDDPRVVGEMIQEVSGEPAALSLLQVTARLMWDRRDRSERKLRRDSYREMGGVAGAFALHADGVLDGLTAAQRRLAREILLRLTTAEGTRRPLPVDRVLSTLGGDSELVLDRLIQGRLLSLNKPAGELVGADSSELVELAHESLVSTWSTLRCWLNEGRQEKLLFDEVEQAADLWHRRGRPDDALWHQDALLEALRVLGRRSQALPELIHQFLTAGKRKRQRSRRRWQLAVALLVLVPSALAAAVYSKEREATREKQLAQLQRSHAETQRRRARRQWAEAQREGAWAALGQERLLEARAKLRGSLEQEDSLPARILWKRLSDHRLLWKRALGAFIYSVSFSPDGRSIAVGSQNQSLQIYDVRTGEARALRGHGDQIVGITYGPRGNWLVAGLWNGQVALWDLKRQRKRLLVGHRAGVYGLAIDPRAERLATASVDATIRLWSLPGGVPQRVLHGHTVGVRAVTFSPDGRLLASAGLDQTVRIWDPAAAQQLHVLRGHHRGVLAVRFSPDGRLLASAGSDARVRIWNTQTGALVRVFPGAGASINALAFRPLGRHLATADAKGWVRIFEVASGRQLWAFQASAETLRTIAYSPNGQWLATGGHGRTLQLWKADPKRMRAGHSGHASPVHAVRISHDSRLIASGGDDFTVRLWSSDTGQVVRVLRGHRGRVNDLAFRPRTAQLASASFDGTVRLWDTSSGQLLRELSCAKRPVYAVLFSPDGDRLYASSFDGFVTEWSVAEGRRIKRVKTHSLASAIALGRTGRLLLTSGFDGLVRLWRLPAWTLLRTLSGHRAEIRGAALSSDGRVATTTSVDGQLARWDLSRARIRQLVSLKGRGYRLAMHPRGREVVVPMSDGTTRILGDDLSIKRVLQGHRDEVNIARFSPDGSLTVTASDDTTVRLFGSADGIPKWRAPLLLDRPPRLVSHQGWRRLDRPRGLDLRERPERRWQRALSSRALRASVVAGDTTLCFSTHHGQLEIWDRHADLRLWAGPVPRIRRLLAIPRGCLTLSNAGAALHSRSGQQLLRVSAATAIERTSRSIYVAVSRSVRRFDHQGRLLASAPGGVGVTAILHGGSRLLLGFSDGTVEERGGGARAARLPLQSTPASAVVRLVRGPRHSVAVGFANGQVGLWSLESGRPLILKRIHGPVVHMLFSAGVLYAASDLGHHTVVDLSTLHMTYCALLRRVWKQVPVRWSKGRPQLGRPALNHPCLPSLSGGVLRTVPGAPGSSRAASHLPRTPRLPMGRVVQKR